MPQLISTTALAYAHLLAALAIGSATEAGARLLRLWRYRSLAFPILNILVVFGLIQGLVVGWVIGGRQNLLSIAPVLFMVGAVIGILLEGLNLYWWRAWSWPAKPLLGIERPIDKAAFIGFIWGFAPVLAVILARLALTRGLEV
jgi:hypothetical protein